MIAYLQGKILHSDGERLILLTATGIGYEIFYKGLVAPQTDKEFYIYSVYREDSQELFGFDEIEDRQLFVQLIQVRGVGPKSAYTLLVNLGRNRIIDAILFDQKNVLKEAPGIGPKAAAQIILDLKDKMAKGAPAKKQITRSKTSSSEVPASTNVDFISDAIMAGAALGLKEGDVMELARQLMKNKEYQNSEELVRDILKRSN